MKKLLLSGAALILVSGATALAHADAFTYTNAIGAKYALDESLVSGTTYDIYLTIDASSLTGTPATTTLGDVAIKVSNSYTNLTFVSAPSGYTLESGGLNNNGCDGSGGGFFCFNGSAPAGSAGDMYTFEAQVTLPAALTNTSSGSIKDIFYAADGTTKTSQDSFDTTIGLHTPTTAAPEPSSLAMLGSGMLGLAAVVRRRFHRG